MPLHRLTTLILGVPDPDAVGRYYEEFGLTALGGRRYATEHGGEQLRLVTAPTRRVVELGVGTDDVEDLDRIASRLAGMGADSRREGDALLATDPGSAVTVRVEVAAPIAQPAEPSEAHNAPGSTVRRGRRADTVVRDDPQAFRPRKLGHVVVGSLDHEHSTRWLTEGIGFKVSDRIKGRGAFMRCSTDHHNLLVTEAPARFLHHTSWQLPDVDAVGQAAMALVERDPDRHVWGLGRHYVGSNFFWYLKDPAGNYSEYYSDMDVIDDDAAWVPQEWEGPKSFYSWGPPPPAIMRAPADLAALMAGAHS